MNKKLLSLYSLKFNTFPPEVPTSALWSAPSIESFCWRIEQQIGEGGFALAIGDPGTGKSAALRILAEHLGNLRDVVVGVLSRPQASLADFYRELGHLFSVPLAPHNRWASAKALREKWLHHIENSLYRPVLLIDEAHLPDRSRPTGKLSATDIGLFVSCFIKGGFQAPPSAWKARNAQQLRRLFICETSLEAQRALVEADTKIESKTEPMMLNH